MTPLLIWQATLDADGGVLWASGRTNKLGAIVDGVSNEVLPSEQPVKFPDAPFQPHYQRIDRQHQAQIYQELVEDSDRQLTTSFLRRVYTVKDNRLRPQGYDPEFFRRSSSHYIRKLAETHGAAAEERSDEAVVGRALGAGMLLLFSRGWLRTGRRQA